MLCQRSCFSSTDGISSDQFLSLPGHHASRLAALYGRKLPDTGVGDELIEGCGSEHLPIEPEQ